jgi:hypothetical protein
VLSPNRSVGRRELTNETCASAILPKGLCHSKLFFEHCDHVNIAVWSADMAVDSERFAVRRERIFAADVELFGITFQQKQTKTELFRDSITELQTDLIAWLERVRAVEEVLVNDLHRPIAKLVPVKIGDEIE